jgi:hypothetical protein
MSDVAPTAALNWMKDWLGVFAFAGAVVLLALVERLRATFASTKDLDGHAERIDRAMQGTTKRIDVQEASMGDFDVRLDEQHDRISRLEGQTAADARLIREIVVKPLERLVSRLEALTSVQERQGAALDGLTRTVERLERRLDGNSRH